MSIPYHHHTTILKIDCAGEEREHELDVEFLYKPALPPVCAVVGLPMEPVLSAQVEVSNILERIYGENNGYKCTSYILKKTAATELAWEHIEAIEQEILEGLE